MTTSNKYKVVNWSLVGFVIVLMMGLFGYIIQDSKTQANQISINTNRLTVIESKPFISSKEDIDKIKEEIVVIKIKQASMEGKLNMIIAIVTDVNHKLDKHINDSILKSQER